MRRESDEGFVLETRTLGDADLIVTLLSECHGQVRAVARSARRSRRRFGGSLEPLTRVRASWVEREGRELHRLETLECVRSFAEMQAEPRRQAACAVLADVARTFVHEGEPDPRTFRLLGAVLAGLDAAVEPRLVLRYFEYWILRLHGLLPDLERCGSCERPLGPRPARVARGGGLVCARCAGSATGSARRVGAAERELLGALARLPPERLPAAARPATTALEALLRGTLESFAERTFRTYRHFAAVDLAPAVEAASS